MQSVAYYLVTIHSFKTSFVLCVSIFLSPDTCPFLLKCWKKMEEKFDFYKKLQICWKGTLFSMPASQGLVSSYILNPPTPTCASCLATVLYTLRKLAYSNILKISPPKTESFQIKILIFFHISAQNIDCGYSLEPHRRGGSNEYPQSMFLSRNKKNNVNPSFTV